MSQELVLVLDFGGQYNQLIARRVREAHVYSEMVSYKTSIEEIRKRNPKGIIFSGGPASVNQEGAPQVDSAIYELGIPILGICYGMQLMTIQLGGKSNILRFGNTAKPCFKWMRLKAFGKGLTENVNAG